VLFWCCIYCSIGIVFYRILTTDPVKQIYERTHPATEFGSSDLDI
jgi:hypothetical protein